MSEEPLYSRALPMARRPMFLSMGQLAYTYGPADEWACRGSRFLRVAVGARLNFRFSVAQKLSGPDVARFTPPLGPP